MLTTCVYLGTKSMISPEEILTEPSTALSSQGFVDAYNTKTELETSFNNACKLQQPIQCSNAMMKFQLLYV